MEGAMERCESMSRVGMSSRRGLLMYHSAALEHVLTAALPGTPAPVKLLCPSSVLVQTRGLTELEQQQSVFVCLAARRSAAASQNVSRR